MGKSIKNAVVIILILILSISTASLIYLHFFSADDENLSGEWTANQDMTKQAAVTALSWLQDIEAVSVSLEEVESHMKALTIQVNLTMEQTARSEGIFYCNVMAESYETCNQAAYEAFAGIFREMVAERLLMAGYEGGVDMEDIEALVIETFGMSTVSYLMECVPDLLPPLEELQSWYDGSGTYEISEGILTRRFEGKTDEARTERCIRQDSSLILYEETDSAAQDLPSAAQASFSDCYPVIYTLKPAQNQ